VASIQNRGRSLGQCRGLPPIVGIDFPIYHDPSWEISDKYGLLGLPGTFLMDAEGRLVRRWTGGFDPMAEDVQDEVRKVLASDETPEG